MGGGSALWMVGWLEQKRFSPEILHPIQLTECATFQMAHYTKVK